MHQSIQLHKKKLNQLPDVFFLDLNMLGENGFTSIQEIGIHNKLKHFPIIVLTTLFEETIVQQLYKCVAPYNIYKLEDDNLHRKVNNLVLSHLEKIFFTPTYLKHLFFPNKSYR